MVCSIIGWYGTETMGDKAILDGILQVLSCFKVDIVQLGSLFPFYSERTLCEEKEVYANSGNNIEINVFDLKDKDEIDENISATDMVIFGGGPLMDLEELYLIKYVVKCAKNKDIPVIIMGAGIGPLKNETYSDIVREILGLSDLIILRDELSRRVLEEKYNNDFGAVVLPDPALISIEEYRENNVRHEENYRVINLRDYYESVYSIRLMHRRGEWIEFIKKVAEEADRLFFIPMHNFYIGEDDRYCLAELLGGEKITNLTVLDRPFDLYTLYKIIMNAQSCVGMRYHSVVMQTVLNGNNIIIDYTGINSGKIYGFISDSNNKEGLLKRRYSIRSDAPLDIERFVNILNSKDRYNYSYRNIKKVFIDAMKEYF